MTLVHNLSLNLTSYIKLELIYIPAGEFLMGSDPVIDTDTTAHELPQHKMSLDAFYIGKTPVTVAQFAAFVEATGYKTTAEQSGHGFNLIKNQWEAINGAHWRKPHGEENIVQQKKTHPVTLVSWYDILAFCDWVTRITQHEITLPSEAQWERAARGVGGFVYPWGNNKPTERLCNYNSNIKDTSPVGQYSPQGDSPVGCTDMAGNVIEWTRSLWGRDLNAPEYPYPYSKDKNERENIQAPDDIRRVVRGGAWDDESESIRSAHRFANPLISRNNLLGFRVASLSELTPTEPLEAKKAG
jgi:formylglycine-generating enzyme required for sulfatase activity